MSSSPFDESHPQIEIVQEGQKHNTENVTQTTSDLPDITSPSITEFLGEGEVLMSLFEETEGDEKEIYEGEGMKEPEPLRYRKWQNELYTHKRGKHVELKKRLEAEKTAASKAKALKDPAEKTADDGKL